MDFTLHIWRQAKPSEEGAFHTYRVTNVSPHMSFIEMLEYLNSDLESRGVEPVAYECDCLEGICGTCSLMINGRAHGPENGTTTCQLHMRSFENGANIVVEPWRATAFPVLRDLVVDRSAFDRIIQAGGYVSVRTGSAPDGNAIPIPKEDSDLAMEAAQCIGCGACVASCKNSSAMLFTAAKVTHLALLPQGQPERYSRAIKMVEQMEEEGFGACTNQQECEAACPKDIGIKFIAKMNRDYLKAMLMGI
ncbi:MAG TPA: succinate dehydrogenase/fumarate reductase iron-sulfur subunit [Oligoflexia bacterium]|nr:succinate dehydrogenase/fumarate reductase iron-sulfur subunit [Oligoflexia bacterium]HMP49485.1 succinate dehydrogenase/fumarate reductase iron-sulfur subunit [Oligoflexia bacterium]